MYSRNKYCRSCRDFIEDDEMLTPEEEELRRYELPPRYDGSRFSSRTREKKITRQENESPDASRSKEETLHDTTAEQSSKHDCDTENTTSSKPSELSRLLDGISHEELLIISLILIVAESEDGGEMILFLLLLLLQS